MSPPTLDQVKHKALENLNITISLIALIYELPEEEYELFVTWFDNHPYQDMIKAANKKIEEKEKE